MADRNPPGAMVAGGKEASIHGECLRIEQHTPPGSLNRRERRRRLTREMTPAISGRQWSGGPHRYRAVPGMKEEDIAAGRTRDDLPGELSRRIDTPAESQENVTEV